MSTETRYPIAQAQTVAERWLERLAPYCDLVAVAGSVRRRKPQVKDVELIFAPKNMVWTPPGDLFEVPALGSDIVISLCERLGEITRRPNVNGSYCWGPQIKLAIDTASGMPLDLFATTMGDWFSYLICRTGSAAHNIRLASRAQAMGYQWHPYKGLQTEDDFIQLESEAHLYQLLKLPYLKPWERSE